MSNAIDEAVAVIDRRLAELEDAIEEYRRLRAARTRILNDDAEGDGRRPIQARKAEIIKFVRSHPGARVIDVARDQGVTGARATQILNQLEAEGRIERSESGLIAKLMP